MKCEPGAQGHDVIIAFSREFVSICVKKMRLFKNLRAMSVSIKK